MSAAPSNTSPRATRTGRFSFREPTLFFPRVQLFPDRLILSGWRWRGRYRRQIPLKAILQVDVTSTGWLLIWLTSGETVRLRLEAPEAWKWALERCQAPMRRTEGTPPATPKTSD